jgi:hypothetical protein
MTSNILIPVKDTTDPDLYTSMTPKELLIMTQQESLAIPSHTKTLPTGIQVKALHS